MADKVLYTEALSGGYTTVPIVEDVSIHVNKGEIVALIGPNGSGKSTLLKTIYGIIRVFNGVVVFDGRNVTKTPPEKKTALGMSYVPQTDNIFPDLTVRENLEMGAYLENNPDKIKEAMEMVFNIFPQLKELQNVLGGSLSGGQQRMLAVGRALMTKPKLLLLDEPTAGLAPKIAMELLDLLEKIRSETGISILIVEQHAKRALGLSDRGYVLVSGRIVAEGTGDEILSRPDLQKLFLGVTAEAIKRRRTKVDK